MPPLLRAERDVQIRPGWVARVPVEGPVEGCNKWFMERITLPTRNGCFLVAPSTLIKTKELVVAVANTSPSAEWVRKGDVLGVLHDPEQYLDRSKGDEETQHLEAYACVVQKIARGSLGDKDLLDQALAKSQALEIPSTPDDPDELWGPKMSEPADLTMYNSKRLEELIDIAPDAPPEIRARTLALISKHIQAFGFDDCLGTLDTVTRIRMKEEAQPVSVPMYRASPAKRQVIDEQMDKWIRQEVVEPLKSPWATPVVIVYQNGKPRFCVDYRKLNTMTIPDEFPIPQQTEILQALSGSQVLSALNALSGFHQMTMEDEDKEKTLFRSHRGLWQFKRMPFGLRNGPSIFQRMMQSILAPFLWTFSLVYIDDIVVYSKSYKEHLEHLDQVLSACAEAHLTLAPKKCHFMYTLILLLGQKVSRLGLSTHKEKIKAVTELACPLNKATLQTFLGMAVYFSHFIPHYSE
jgi:Reverse transcriptase (RNA-dependent DNA polymerase)